jgi:hypothetical protein
LKTTTKSETDDLFKGELTKKKRKEDRGDLSKRQVKSECLGQPK